jgi:hypothetical protein
MIHGVGARMPCLSEGRAMRERMLDLAEFALWLTLAAVVLWMFRTMEGWE